MLILNNIGRRSVKRELKNTNPELTELELERTCSQVLASRNEQNSKEIDFKVDFMLNKSLCMCFTLLDHLPSHADLADFDTLVHFIHVFVNTSLEKCFPQWLSSHSKI